MRQRKLPTSNHYQKKENTIAWLKYTGLFLCHEISGSTMKQKQVRLCEKKGEFN